jgi:hypothetical protein
MFPGGIIIGFFRIAASNHIRKSKNSVMKRNMFLGLALSLVLFFFSSCGPSALTVSARPESPYYVSGQYHRGQDMFGSMEIGSFAVVIIVGEKGIGEGPEQEFG